MKNGLKTVFLSVMICLAFVVSAAELKDGIYPGKAGGHNGSLRVAVTVKGGKISDVDVTSHKESRRADKALREMPRRIVKADRATVDAISGATVTSDAIKAAVKNALKEAR